MDAGRDFNLSDHEPGVMLLPSGRRVTARHSQSRVFATLDPSLNRGLRLDRETFATTTGFLRASATHDGLPFQPPVEMQPLIHAVILTHYQMDLDHRGDLNSYTLSTQHAAIGGFHYFQRVEPFYTNFQRLVEEICRDRQFCTYPLSTHLNQSWLGGNLQLPNQRSASERDHDPRLLRAYGHQQLDWMVGVTSLANHASFRTRHDGGRRVVRTGGEMEQDLDFDGLALHQMNRLLRVDSCLFPRPTRAGSPWPGLHRGFSELDQRLLTESLPKL